MNYFNNKVEECINNRKEELLKMQGKNIFDKTEEEIDTVNEMKKILYFEPDDATTFDLERFTKSLNNYAKVPANEIKEALKEFDNYETLHVSRLVELSAALIMKNGDEKAAKEYHYASNMPKMTMPATVRAMAP